MDEYSEIIQPNADSRLWSQWTEVSLIAARGDRQVYRGKRYGRWFILKTYRQQTAEYRQLLTKEFSMGASLDHPNIVHTITYETIPDIGECIVMEYIDGCTLTDFLATKPDKSTRIRLVRQLVDALSYLHSRQMVHGDLKPTNILITHNGHNLKLIDFGLSNTDDDAYSRPNDSGKDIAELGRVLGFLQVPYSCVRKRCSRGYYTSCEQVKRAIYKADLLRRWWPLGIGIICLFIALGVSSFVYFRPDPREEIIQLVHLSVDSQAHLLYDYSPTDLVDAYTPINEYYQCCFKMRDSIAKTIDNEVLRNDFINSQAIYSGQVAQQYIDSVSVVFGKKD